LAKRINHQDTKEFTKRFVVDVGRAAILAAALEHALGEIFVSLVSLW
jgi:hypothetical protein